MAPAPGCHPAVHGETAAGTRACVHGDPCRPSARSQSHGRSRSILESPARPSEEGTGILTGHGVGSATACRHGSQCDHVHRQNEEAPTEQNQGRHRRLEVVLRTRSGWVVASAAGLLGERRRPAPSSGLRWRSCQWGCPEPPARQQAGPSQRPCYYLSHSVAEGRRPGQLEQLAEGTQTAVLAHLQAGQAAETAVGKATPAVLVRAPEPAALQRYWAGRQMG